MLSKHIILGLGAVGAAILLAGTANAEVVSLDSLAGTSATITSNGLVYSNFTYGGSLPASDVLLTTTDSGVQFSTASGSGWTVAANSAVIRYDVTATSGTLNGVGLSFTASASGGAVAAVGETVWDNATPKPNTYSLQVTAGTANDKSTDSVTLNPAAATIHVVKSLDIAAPTGVTSASITLVDNTYVPSGGTNPPPPGVPEPMSLALLPLAIAGLGLRKKLAR